MRRRGCLMKNSAAVIMSVYKNDRLEYLKAALESLYAQTYHADVFVMLDGKVPSQVEAYLDNERDNKRIAFLGKRDDNRGLAISLNELLDVVLPMDYAYILRMDADDISVPQRIERQIGFLESHNDIDMAGGWIEEFNTDTGQKQIIRYGKTHDDLKKNLMKRNPVAHVTVCFRKRFFDTIPRYDASMHNEDLDLWIRAFAQGLKLYVLPEVLVKVRTSNAFFERRRNISRALEVMDLKLKATRLFEFGIKGYVYAVAHFLLFMAPRWIKRMAYKYMRG